MNEVSKGSRRRLKTWEGERTENVENVSASPPIFTIEIDEFNSFVFKVGCELAVACQPFGMGLCQLQSNRC